MSVNKKTIMIFGGGELQTSLISTAKNMGLYTVVIDPNFDAVGKGIADIFYKVRGDDYQSTLDLANKYKISGVVTTATDKPLLMMARIASALNLPFPQYNSILNTIIKSKFKQILLNNNISCAKGVLINKNSDLRATIQVSKLNFPLITKPTDNSGSRGVIYCSDMEALLVSVKETFMETNSSSILLEEYIEGDEISVEAFVQNKIVHIIQITDKKTTDFPFNVEIEHTQPSKYKEEHSAVLLKLIQKIVDAVGLDNCGLHPELKFTNAGWKIIEMGPRLGGDYITSHLVPLSTGVNIEELMINISLGNEVYYTVENKSARIEFFSLKGGEVLEKYPHQIESPSSDIVKSCFDLKIGDTIPFISNSLDRYGFLIHQTNERI